MLQVGIEYECLGEQLPLGLVLVYRARPSRAPSAKRE